MPSIKPKIQGYVEQATFERFEIYRQENELSQSQALEKILYSFFGADNVSFNGGKQAVEKADPYYESWRRVNQQLENIQSRLAILEIASNLQSDIPSNLQSDIPSNLQSDIPSNLQSDIPSNLQSDIPSNLRDIPSNLRDIPSNLQSDIPSNLQSDIPSNLQSNLESDIPSNLQSNLESDIPSNLQSNLQSDIPSNLLTVSQIEKGLGQRELAKRLNCSHPYVKELAVAGNLYEWSRREDPQGLGWELRGKKYCPVEPNSENLSKSLPGDKETFVVYEFDKETNQYRYWSGGYRMFDSSLHHACKYKSEETASKSLSLVENNEGYVRELDNHQAGRFTIGFETVEYLAQNRKHQLKIKESAM